MFRERRKKKKRSSVKVHVLRRVYMIPGETKEPGEEKRIRRGKRGRKAKEKEEKKGKENGERKEKKGKNEKGPKRKRKKGRKGKLRWERKMERGKERKKKRIGEEKRKEKERKGRGLRMHSCRATSIHRRNPDRGSTYEDNYFKWMCLATCHAKLHKVAELWSISILFFTHPTLKRFDPDAAKQGLAPSRMAVAKGSVLASYLQNNKKL